MNIESGICMMEGCTYRGKSAVCSRCGRLNGRLLAHYKKVKKRNLVLRSVTHARRHRDLDGNERRPTA